MAVEFALVFLASLSLFGLAGEFFRISMIDQTLARVTHQSAEAIAGLPDGDVECEDTVQSVFDRDVGARWLFDRNGGRHREHHLQLRHRVAGSHFE